MKRGLTRFHLDVQRLSIFEGTLGMFGKPFSCASKHLCKVFKLRSFEESAATQVTRNEINDSFGRKKLISYKSIFKSMKNGFERDECVLFQQKALNFVLNR